MEVESMKQHLTLDDSKILSPTAVFGNKFTF